VWSADDPVAAVLAGRAAEVNLFEEGSDFGLFTVLRHAWPGTGRPFYTLYAHLSDVRVRVGEEVQTGSPLGRMGQTSRNADARNWMAIAPHLHFEVWNEAGESHDPAEFLSRWLPRH
jgi:murein DD-endopeptidase MepM/ murein hydrolase activator NlpD